MVCVQVVVAGLFPGAASAGNVLVFGLDDNGTEGDNAASTLTALGHSVERSAALPPTLDGYSSVWYIEAYSGLTIDERERLSSYIKEGGSAYLTGERPCCEELNDDVEAVLRSVLADQDVQVGDLGDIPGPFTFNTSVTDHVASAPNLLVDFVPHSPGGMAGLGGINAHNVFASNGSTPVGGIWSDKDMLSQQGRIALLMDIDWLDDPERVSIIQNIQNFLDRGVSCSDASHHDGMLWTGPTETNGPSNCTTILTPKEVTWTVGSDAGPVTLEVQATGTDADCDIGPFAGATRARCKIDGGVQDGASLVVKAGDSLGQTVRWYRVRPQNDPRNVPVPFSLSSKWWDWPDHDEDGIPTHWEQNGVWVKNEYLDLSGRGARWDHKDLFLHYDFESGQELAEQVFDRMREAFASAPLGNPDGTDGVSLHVQRGGSVPASVVGDFDLTSDDVQRVTTYSSFAAGPEFGGGGVPQIYKWMLNFDQGPGGVGKARLKGGFGWTAFPINAWVAALELETTPGVAVNFVEAVNAVHELGHLLGIHHHGADALPDHAPEYKSVMTYSYSHFGIPGRFGFGAQIDYSRTHVVNLDWRVGESIGAITFLRGQHGEEPDFYAANNAERLDLGGAAPDEPTVGEALQAADPDSLRGFIEEFGLAAAWNPPTVEDAIAEVAAGGMVEIPLKATNPEGGALSFVVDVDGQKGIATATPTGIHYEAQPGASGVDTIKVRAVNSTFGSAQASIQITVLSPGGKDRGGGEASGQDTTAASAVSDACKRLKGKRRAGCLLRRKIEKRCGSLKRKPKKACAQRIRMQERCRRTSAKAPRNEFRKEGCRRKAT